MPPIAASSWMQIQPMGLLITNGQFVAFEGENPIEIVVSPDLHRLGPAPELRLSGGRPCRTSSRTARASSPLQLLFQQRPTRNNPGKALVEADGGKLQVQGCSFATPEPSILLGKGLKHAIVTGNNGVKGVKITNQIGGRAILSATLNQPMRLNKRN